MRHVCNGSEFTIITFDTNHSPNNELRHVGLEVEFAVLIRVLRHGAVVKAAFKALNEAFSFSPKLNTTSLQVKSTMG